MMQQAWGWSKAGIGHVLFAFQNGKDPIAYKITLPGSDKHMTFKSAYESAKVIYDYFNGSTDCRPGNVQVTVCKQFSRQPIKILTFEPSGSSIRFEGERADFKGGSQKIPLPDGMKVMSIDEAERLTADGSLMRFKDFVRLTGKEVIAECSKRGVTGSNELSEFLHGRKLDDDHARAILGIVLEMSIKKFKETVKTFPKEWTK